MIAKRLGRLAALSLIAVAVGCSSTNRVASPAPSPSPSGLPIGTLIIQSRSGTIELQVQVAETDKDRQRGLMGVTQLGADAGMAFLFDDPVRTGFWMKDTLIPLSIAFWDAGGRIVDILEMTPCRKIPCPIYSPSDAYVGAVEANRGFFAGRSVRPGDLISLKRS
jgi:uncharacterized membrane protein (UPF0127 family)